MPKDPVRAGREDPTPPPTRAGREDPTIPTKPSTPKPTPGVGLKLGTVEPPKPDDTISTTSSHHGGAAPSDPGTLKPAPKKPMPRPQPPAKIAAPNQ